MKTSEILTYKKAAESEKVNTRKGTEILFAIIGLLAGRVEIWGMIMPTGVSWAIANGCKNKKNNRLAVAVLCSGAGMLLAGADIYRLRGLITLAAIYALSKTNNELFGENILLSSVIGAAINFICGAIIVSVSGVAGFDYIMLAIEAVLIAGCSIAFFNAAEVFNRGGTLLSDDEAISMFVVAACSVAGLGGIEIGGVALSRIVSLYMIVFAAEKWGIGISVTLAAVLGAAIGGDDIVSVLGLFVFMAIGCGLLAGVGKWGILLGAALANAVYVACRMGADNSFIRVAEIIIAVSAFYITPEKVKEKIAGYTSRQRVHTADTSRILHHKNETDSVMSELQSAVTAMAEVVREMNNPEEGSDHRTDIMKKVAGGVCKECTLNNCCTGKNRQKTTQAINYIVHMLEEKGVCEIEEISRNLAWSCIHPDRVVEKINDTFEFYREKGIETKRTHKNREFAANGLADMAEIIARQRERIAAGYDTYETLAEEISEGLVLNGIPCGGVCVVKNHAGLFEVAAEIEGNNPGLAEEIIRDIMKIKMKTVSEEKCNSGILVTMQEKEHYAYEVAVMSLDSKERRSGDTAVWFDDGRGSLYCLVGDGMGSGALAAKESGWTVKLFEKLARAGFEPGEALRMINNVMIAGKPEESCISADAVKINLHSGIAEFTKAGAASSYIKTAKGAEKIGWSTLPLGILEISQLDSRCCDLSEGGFIVIMSDGVPDTAGDRMEGEHQLRRALELCDEEGPKEVAEHLMFASMSMGAPKDDMTIIAVKITKK